MSNRALFRFEGLDELRAALRRLPSELTNEAELIVSRAADDARDRIVSRYPVGPGNDTYGGGNLRDHVRVVEQPGGQFGATRIVKSTARHAFIFERGTKTRKTSKGYHRGVMPAADIFVDEAQRRRKQMYDELAALVERAGFRVEP